MIRKGNWMQGALLFGLALGASGCRFVDDATMVNADAQLRDLPAGMGLLEIRLAPPAGAPQGLVNELSGVEATVTDALTAQPVEKRMLSWLQIGAEGAAQPALAVAQAFLVLPPGEYQVVGTPLGPNSAPSPRCQQSEPARVTVRPGQTTQAVLHCACGIENGAIDINVVVGERPLITDLVFSPGSTAVIDQPVEIRATVDPRGGARVSFGWELLEQPAGAGIRPLEEKSDTLRFRSAVPGIYRFVLTACTQPGLCSTLAFQLNLLAVCDEGLLDRQVLSVSTLLFSAAELATSAQAAGEKPVAVDPRALIDQACRKLADADAILGSTRELASRCGVGTLWFKDGAELVRLEGEIAKLGAEISCP